MTDIRSIWQRLESWGESNAPNMLEDLNPPADDAAISVLEDQLGLQLPDAFKTTLQIHDGENDGWPCKVFADRGAFLPATRIADEWRQRQEIAGQIDLDDDMDPEELAREGIISVSGPVNAVMFDRAWIPIMDCNGDVFWALDFNPANGGVAGQVIEVDWECCSWTVIAKSFQELLESYVDELEAGAFQVKDGQPTKQ